MAEPLADDRVFADGSLAAPPRRRPDGPPNISWVREAKAREETMGATGGSVGGAGGKRAEGDTSAPYNVDAVKARELVGTYRRYRGKERRKVMANPPAALTHKQEERMPWRIAPAREIDADNERARREVHEKRLTNLATQASRGMQKNFGIHYDMSSLRNILVEAWKMQEAGDLDEDSLKPGGGRPGTASSGKSGKSGASAASSKAAPSSTPLQVLDAVQRYDLKKVIELLGLDVPDKSDKALTERTIAFASTITHGKLPKDVTGELPGKTKRWDTTTVSMTR